MKYEVKAAMGRQFTEMMSFIELIDWFSNLITSAIPTLLTRILGCILSSQKNIFQKNPWLWLLLKSAQINLHSRDYPNYSFNSLIFISIFYLLLETRQILYPCAASYWQKPKPMPSEAPVTMAHPSPYNFFSSNGLKWQYKAWIIRSTGFKMVKSPITMSNDVRNINNIIKLRLRICNIKLIKKSLLLENIINRQFYNYLFLQLPMNQSRWNLKDQYIATQIQRLDHQQYFSYQFQCTDLDALIREIKIPADAIRNRTSLNKFYDHLISSNNSQKTLYVRLKWLVYLHRLIHQFHPQSIMYVLTLKALQIYIEKFGKCVQSYGYFEKYLSEKLFKPYLQYTSKLCMLNMAEKQNREDGKENNDLCNKMEKSHFQIEITTPRKSIKRIQESSERKSEQRVKWYRNYNFVLSTLETFTKVLKEQQQFFSSTLPYLMHIKKYISRDLKQILNQLKQTSIPLDNLSMTMMELDRLDNKILDFSKPQSDLFENYDSAFMTDMKDYTREDLTNFLSTPIRTPFENRRSNIKTGRIEKTPQSLFNGK